MVVDVFCFLEQNTQLVQLFRKIEFKLFRNKGTLNLQIFSTVIVSNVKNFPTLNISCERGGLSKKWTNSTTNPKYTRMMEIHNKRQKKG